MSDKYKINDNKLELKSGVVDFNHNIKEVIFYNNIYIILLNIPNHIDEVDNIYGVNSQGEIIWRIESPEIVFPVNELTEEYANMSKSIYTAIHKQTNEEFVGHTFFAFKYKFDYKTGKLLGKELGRW